ncbi:hypothetical protein CRM22_008934 [Opisthorchis felineus]|uniref:F-ATPase delta subunit n=1 Tax=Opisthorchis felineus TaxID=147828 RepID=A0A4S2L9M5_OPIFE|nr:hypothetical protein CRM22_008934 [Opisthorchis felineus]
MFVLGNLARRCAFYGLRNLSTSNRVHSELTLTFASTGQVFYNKEVVRQVDVPTLTGRFGVLAEHVPTIACLMPGLVSVTESDGTVKSYFVSSGTVTVNSDSSMQVLAEEAATLDQLDVHAVKEGLTRAQAELLSAQTDVSKAEAQIAIEVYEELAHATEGRH